ncbi:hypothetical protein RHGRI_008950 [Rhododendron griersonianum]|uniref:Uncharacterized protein n=2 Tax=Rhododendron TaxID=4346 RepID=A0AAV6L2C5_9ERIC
MEGSLARRYEKVVWRTLVISNLALGGTSSANTWACVYFIDEIVSSLVLRLPVSKDLCHCSCLGVLGDSWQKAYMLARAGKKDTAAQNRKARAKQPSTPVATTATSVPEEPFFSPPIIEPVSDSS